MSSLYSLSHRTLNLVKLAVAALITMAGVLVFAVVPAAAATPTIANGNAAYTPGSTSPPNQFNVLTLVSGGAASVNTSSLTVLAQPSSGSATVATTSTTGIVTYTPASGTTGVQTLTFAYCAPGDTYPSAGNCTTATLSYTPSSSQYFGGQVEGTSVVEQLAAGVVAPTTAVQGSTISMSIAPVATSIPSSESGGGVSVTVESASQFSVIMPIPKGFTYVPGSIGTTGGDATTTGNFAASYCTAPLADACTAQIDSGNYKTVYPYIETYLNPNTTIAGGNNVTLPTVTAQFTASGNVGTVVPVDLTEFVLTTTVSIIGAATFDGYPSCSSCGSSNPPTYSAPTPLANTTITAAAPTVAVTGVNPDSGSPSGNTSVTITGTDLGNASAVDFGSNNPGTITADSATSITATSPPGTGTVDITVTTPDGTSATNPADEYSYSNTAPPPTLTSISPSAGPVIGGNSVTVHGTNLGGATAVDFGQTPGIITADSSSSVTATAPSGTGTVDITVTTPGGTTTPAPADQYAFGVQTLTKLSTWTDTQACGIPATTSAPSGASQVTVAASGGTGGGGGGAASSDSGGSGGSASSVTGSTSVSGGEQLTGISGCAGATAPNGSGVVSTGGAGGIGYSNGGGGGNGYYCAGIDIEGVCVGDGGADGSGGGGGGSSAVCVGSSCQVGVTPVVVAAGGGGGGESMCAGSGGGGGGTGGGGSSTSSVDLTGAGNSGTNGGMGATSGDVGGAGGVNNTGGSASGTPGGPGSNTVSAGDSAGNGGGGGGFVGGNGSTATAGVDCGAGGGGGAGSSWAVNGSGASFSTTNATAAVTLTFYGFVGTAPAITTQPSSATVNAGHAATFTAAASGNPSPDVQWQVSTNGGSTFSNISGATSATLSFTASSSQTGNEYQAVFTNSLGTKTTNPATLTVDSPPAITTQPNLALVIAGQTAVFTAAASGNPTPTVQWQVSTDGGATFSNIAGATSGTLAFATTAVENGNEYQAVFTNSVGSTTTNAVGLTVEEGPTVTTEPLGATVDAGQPASFTAAASGNPTPTVQWQVSTDGGATFSNIAGATSPTYTLTTTAGENGDQYQAVFTNSVGAATSNAATLTVDSLPAITTQPSSTTVLQGATATFTAAASGNPSPTVQWQVSTNGGATFSTIAGATSDTYSFTTAAGESGNKYQAVFTNSVGSTSTNAATLTLATTPVVTTDPTSATVAAGQPATFIAAASGSPAPTVQWEVSTDGGAIFAPIAGATAATYTFTTVLGDNGYQYEAVFTNSAGSATTTPATLTVDVLLITTNSLPDGSVYSSAAKNGYSQKLTASGGNPPYRWSIVGGSLPPGLKLSKTSGTISGKASFAGNYTFTVKVVDKKTKKTKTMPSTQNSATKVLSITIDG
jgi:hypothetical protein